MKSANTSKTIIEQTIVKIDEEIKGLKERKQRLLKQIRTFKKIGIFKQEVEKMQQISSLINARIKSFNETRSKLGKYI